MKDDAMPKRPWTVTTAYYMLWLWVLGFFAISIGWGISRSELSWPPAEGVLMVLIWPVWPTLMLLVFLVCMIGGGRNWARIIYLILFLLGAPFLLLCTIKRTGPEASPDFLLGIYHLEILLVAVILLFQQSSSDWFKTVKKFRKAQSPEAT